MRNRLQVSFWGLHITAEGIAAIVVALLIVLTVVAASRLDLWIAKKMLPDE